MHRHADRIPRKAAGDIICAVAAPRTHIRLSGVGRCPRKPQGPLSLGRESIARTFTADLTREQHPVAVERNKGVFQLVEGSKSSVHAMPIVDRGNQAAPPRNVNTCSPDSQRADCIHRPIPRSRHLHLVRRKSASSFDVPRDAVHREAPHGYACGD